VYRCGELYEVLGVGLVSWMINAFASLDMKRRRRNAVLTVKPVHERRDPDVAPHSSLSSSSPYVLHSSYKAIYHCKKESEHLNQRT